MKVLSIGLALAVVAIVVAAVVLLPDSPQEPDSAQKPTPIPTPTPTAAPTAQTYRVTVQELVYQVQNQKQYKRGDILIITGVVKGLGYNNSRFQMDLEAPEGWHVNLEFSDETRSSEFNAFRPGDRVEVQTTIIIAAMQQQRGIVWTDNSSFVKVKN